MPYVYTFDPSVGYTRLACTCDICKTNEEDKMASAFNKGDTVTLTGKVTYADGDYYEVGVERSNTAPRTVGSLIGKDMKLVKRAVPPTPAAGTVIKVGTIFADKYIVGTAGKLRYIDPYDGSAVEAYSSKWADLDHTPGNVTILG